MLKVRKLSVRYGALTILDDVSFEAGKKEWVMIVGPNGAGKSTVVNSISRAIPYEGTVLYDGKDIKRFKSAELAKRIGVLAQNANVGYSFTVEEIIRLGRYAYSKGLFSQDSKEDGKAVERALELTGLMPIRSQSVLTLSGGERQRAFLAQVLAQDPEMLVLDEPTSHLDLIYQKNTFELIKRWIEETGRSVVSVVHDLSLARAYGTKALLMNKGRLVSSGAAKDVLTRENLSSVYEMDVYGWLTEMLSQWREDD